MDRSETPSQKRRATPIVVALYIGVTIAGLAMAFGIRASAHRSHEQALRAHRLLSHERAVVQATHIEHVFRELYEGMRTIARLPGVRDLTADATLTEDGRNTIQELYNNLYASFAVSELYIVPAGFDPDRPDPVTGKTPSPWTTFDEFIVGRSADQASTDEDDHADLEEIEIHEYRVMRDQLRWFKLRFPHESFIEGLKYPAVGGPLVVTCDNSRYSASDPDDLDRSGVVYSIPFYGRDGELRGCISGVVTVPVLRELLPDGEYVLRHERHALSVVPELDGPWRSSLDSIRGVRPNEDLLCSETVALDIVDGHGPWWLWVGRDNTIVTGAPDVRAASRYRVAGSALVLVLTVSLLICVTLAGKHDAAMRSFVTRLEVEVAERTSDLADSESRLRSVYESAYDAILTIDNDLSSVRDCNPRAASMFGYPNHELRGTLLDRIIPDAQSELSKLSHDATEAGGTTRRLQGITSDGRTLPLDVSASVMQVGGSQYVLCIVRDMTDDLLLQHERDTLHRDLMKASREAGKSEVASGVLHNVGNILNSINATVETMNGRLEQLGTNDLHSATRLLCEHRDHLGRFLETDERGQSLPEFLGNLADHQVTTTESLQNELQSLRSNVRNIRRVVALQQRQARLTNVVETVLVSEIIDDALSLCAAGLERHQINLVRSGEDAISIQTDRYQVTQVLVNLINNARQATELADPGSRRIELRIERSDDLVRIAVRDRGIGIAPEQLVRVFEHGFTTKPDGHGFGLHASALAARQLGGSLGATSDGPGHGACFTLELPMHQQTEEMNAA